jgi:hypothetical protein
MNRSYWYLPALALSIVSIAATAQAQLITSTANLPPVGGVYLDASIHQTYGGAALQLLLSLPQHKVIADEQKFKQGLDQNETFMSDLDANLQVIQNGNTVYNGPIHASGFTNTLVHNRYDSGGNEITTGTFQTEMLSMNLSGNVPMPFLIRESPTLQSLGVTNTTPIGGGQFLINSFFDVFTEISLDGGASWMPSTTGPGHVTLVPEPTTFALVGLGLLGMAGVARRRR